MTVVTAHHSNTTHAASGAMALYHTIYSLQPLATWCRRITPHSCITSLHPGARLHRHLFQSPQSKKKVKGYCNRPGVAQHRVPGGLGSQISMTFGTWRWWGCQPHAPVAFTPRKCSWYSFSLGTELTPGPWHSRKKYVTEKSSDTTGNRSQDRPTSTAVP